MKVPQFSQHYLEQQVTSLLCYHPFCATKTLISLVDISEVPRSESSEASCLLYLGFAVSGQDKMFQFFKLRGIGVWESTSKVPWLSLLEVIIPVNNRLLLHCGVPGRFSASSL